MFWNQFSINYTEELIELFLMGLISCSMIQKILEGVVQMHVKKWIRNLIETTFTFFETNAKFVNCFIHILLWFYTLTDLRTLF